MATDAGIRVQRIGIDLDAPEGSDELEFHCARIRRIENLADLTGLKAMSSLVEKIENLEANRELEVLDLYQNSIAAIENIDHLVNLRVLDLSFNRIERIANVNSLTNLRELYLTSNRIAKVENIGSLADLELLELGSNCIREYDEIRLLPRLKALWLGRNKITHMRLPPLPNLTTCSLQNNRICEWAPEIASSCPELQELYLSFNRLSEIPPLVNRMRKLTILDLGNNHIARINIEEPNDCVVELWLNDNAIEDERDIEPLKLFRCLKVLYLERNPIQAKLGPGYRNRILHILPQLMQLDALAAGNRVT
ncbi:protein phosphatase 1, regulatory (inhibitor) subunit 7, putative [Babesia bigemina]|uniref:Protein phosphatase 1, regulatory (Inhibitor) subunit 7, putative n=1 Tax=Babesia bigemina TaxID=5866 RepID=A0A061D524_BABBI|nr:protein phosphatase 1, regulatory (inhibitor) subunit 7, putative [Babesia bigemina]CDR95147.1 protein phosphatase 1, regulatory (inhibitor) subunit 7, putative [Babesia bigemina]|eukprot:XP_012767333.1 protein phosphatase 1, regulatory (inhibitor) subunit 7, putative [Babesia bigemina]